jgi:hypothetical protein
MKTLKAFEITLPGDLTPENRELVVAKDMGTALNAYAPDPAKGAAFHIIYMGEVKVLP